MPFLTKLDSNAQVKGSRDPLGAQAVWTHLGRRIVGNLTTVSTSVRDFEATMLGYAFVEQLERDAPEVEVFLRWEQWAAFCRVHFQPGAVVRGIDRVRARLAESTRVTISAARDLQILSNQKAYGLWGIYSMPARASGLLETNARLTPVARELVEKEYWERLKPVAGAGARRIAEKLALPSFKLELDGAHRPLASAVAGLLAPPSAKPLSARERDFYTRHLLRHTPTQEAAVATMPPELKKTPALNAGVLQAWSKRAARHDGALALMLDDVRVAESLLAPCSRLFSFLLGEHGQRLSDVVADVRTTWRQAFRRLDCEHLRALGGHIHQATGQRPRSAEQWLAAAEALQAADFDALIRALCEINASVMQARGGARWLNIEHGKVRVHAFEAAGALPAAEELGGLWEHSYFLDSLALVAAALHP